LPLGWYILPLQGGLFIKHAVQFNVLCNHKAQNAKLF